MEELNNSLDLALIRWYDFKSERYPFLYGCPRLKLTEIYTFIDVKAIKDIEHIVPRFNSNNEYFINRFIF